ncbi:hypothetical protein [Cytobacillus dafuensis]|uniref:Uncharacterized protein n=1 Tax=Cytobacillus dafuensis TaxID=1742359 RepID=A0A5B8Z1M4_CYTDA|nr:hypothetical protein [Cytobacillus dafuensis]QED46875.1 hypothetical protein FSZ17_06075 [Cytobacillus dafuensis]
MAPTNPTVDDGFNTYGWTDVPRYSEPIDYEDSVNNGQTWKQVTANPQPVGEGEIRAGAVQARVKSNVNDDQCNPYSLKHDGSHSVS